MKIGIISAVLNGPFTGIGNYTYNLIKELNKLGPVFTRAQYSFSDDS